MMDLSRKCMRNYARMRRIGGGLMGMMRSPDLRDSEECGLSGIRKCPASQEEVSKLSAVLYSQWQILEVILYSWAAVK